MVIKQYEIYLINLDPTIGHESKKTRPCVVISPNEMNANISTIIIAPLTSSSHEYPTRVPLILKGKEGWIVLDQIRTVDKARFIKRLGKIEKATIDNVRSIIQEMLVD